jgi:hypothetical protein
MLRDGDWQDGATHDLERVDIVEIEVLRDVEQ